MKSSFENCIRCTICVENCPVFKVNPEYPGPKQAGPDAERFRLDGVETVDKWITHCTQCKRCDFACSYGVDPSKLILNAQIRYVRKNRKTLPQVLFSNFHHIARLGSLFSVITNFITSLGIIRKMFKLIGLRSDIPFPLFRFKTLQRFRKKEVKSPVLGKKSSGTKKQRKVAFFHGCYLNSNAPDEGWDIIYSCTSCGHTLIYDYPEILDTFLQAKTQPVVIKTLYPE